VKTPAIGLTTLNTLTKEMYTSAKAARDAAAQARTLAAELDKVSGDDVAALKSSVAALAPPSAEGAGGRGGRGGGRGRGPNNAPVAPTLDSVSAQMLNAAMAMQGADVAPTGREIAACAAARRQGADVMTKWTKVKTVDLPAFNAKRKA